jgi:hypothetical protein
MSIKPDGERLASIETTVNDMKLRLFGLDGDSGLIGTLHAMHAANTSKIEEIQKHMAKWGWFAFGVYVAWTFVTSSGVVSLSSAIKLLSKP